MAPHWKYFLQRSVNLVGLPAIIDTKLNQIRIAEGDAAPWPFTIATSLPS
jgi:hypothetical protein